MAATTPRAPQGMSIARYFTPVACVSCGADTTPGSGVIGRGGGGAGLCGTCRGKPQETVVHLNERVREYQRALDHIHQVSSFVPCFIIKCLEYVE